MNPTIDLADAASRQWDAIVIGAGPAGAMAAHQLAKRGRQTLLIERKTFPRYKVCGGCLNRRAMNALDEAGLGGVLRECPAAPLERIVLAQGRGRAKVALTGGVAVARDAFDAAMVRAAVNAGAHFLPGVSARVKAVDEQASNAPSSSHRIVELRGGSGALAHELSAAVVVLACGLGGGRAGDEGTAGETVAAGGRIGVGAIVDGAPNEFAAGAIWMAIGRHGYVGAARLADGRLNVAAAIDPRWMNSQGGAAGAISALLQHSHLPVPANLGQIDWQGTPLLTRQASQVAGWRVLLAGDAAGYVEPFTGEGMAWALSAASAAAAIADAGIDAWSSELETRWQKTHRTLVTDQQRHCRRLAAWLRWPVAVRLGIAAVAAVPAIGRAVERRLALA